jgi:signal transduction histidine kinase
LSASVVLTADSEAISRAITYSGVGFDPANVRLAAGIGVQSMKERALMVGGTWEMKSRTMEGTRIAVTVPIKNASRVTTWAGSSARLDRRRPSGHVVIAAADARLRL